MDSVNYFRFLAALVFVLALIAGCVWLARRFGLMPKVTKTKDNMRRLSIIEVLPIDAKRRLMLIKRDGTEHLLMIGDRETVIESGITHKAADGVGERA